MKETECLVTSRLAAEASSPTYHAVITVRNMQKAIITIEIPKIVSELLSLWRSAFLKTNFNIIIITSLLNRPFQDDELFLRVQPHAGRALP